MASHQSRSRSAMQKNFEELGDNCYYLLLRFTERWLFGWESPLFGVWTEELTVLVVSPTGSTCNMIKYIITCLEILSIPLLFLVSLCLTMSSHWSCIQLRLWHEPSLHMHGTVLMEHREKHKEYYIGFLVWTSGCPKLNGVTRWDLSSLFRKFQFLFFMSLNLFERLFSYFSNVSFNASCLSHLLNGQNWQNWFSGIAPTRKRQD